MKIEPEDCLDPNPCKKNHRLQWVVRDRLKRVWQFCLGCNRKLFVRNEK